MSTITIENEDLRKLLGLLNRALPCVEECEKNSFRENGKPGDDYRLWRAIIHELRNYGVWEDDDVTRAYDRLNRAGAENEEE